MANLTPSASTYASIGIGVPVAILASWIFEQCCHISMPPEVQSAFGAVTSAIVGYFFTGGREIHVAEVSSNDTPPND